MRVWLLLLVTTSLAIGDGQLSEKEAWGMFVKPAQAALEEVPVVGTAFKIMGPIIDKLLEGEDKHDKLVKTVEKGFREISAQITQSVGRVILAVEWMIPREIETKAHTLMQSLMDIFKETTPEHTKFSISSFLQACKERDPYTLVSDMNSHIQNILSKELEHDVYHSKTNLDVMKKKLFGILHELTYVYLFQQKLNMEENIEKRDHNVIKLTRKLEYMKNETDKFLADLLNTNYWSNMDTMTVAIMRGYSGSDLSVKAEKMSKYLFDIYTNDKFCVMALQLGDEAYLPWVYPNGLGDEHGYYNSDYSISILRRQHSSNISLAVDAFIQFYTKQGKCMNDEIFEEYAMNNGVYVSPTKGGSFNPSDVVLSCNDEFAYTPTLVCSVPGFSYKLSETFLIIPR